MAIMPLGRLRLFSTPLFLILTFFLSACGNPAAQPESTQTTPPSQTEAASQQSPSAAEATVMIKHAMGETPVPATPKKVVVLDNGTLDNLLALGVKPIGAATLMLDQPFPSYLGALDGIKSVGTIDQPNLETIASLEPDLILGSKDNHEAIYDKLSQIAPTVFVETLGATWKENLKLQATALGISEKGTQLLEAYERRTAEFKQKMGENLQKTHVSLLRPRKDNVTVYLKQNFAGSIVQDLGLPRPASQDKDEFSLKLNEESISDMGGDVIFWFSRDKENLLNTKIVHTSTWKSLEAVKQNRVFEVDSEVWLSGLGYHAANHVVDDIFKQLTR